MPLSRREFGGLGLAAFAGLVLAPARTSSARRADNASSFFEWKEAAGGAKAAFGQGGNSLLVMSRGQSLFIDTKNVGFGATLRREADAHGSPIRFTVNTHHHADHVGGNPAFKQTSTLIAHEKAKERIVNQVESMLGRVEGAVKAAQEGEKPAPQQVRDEVKAFAESIANVHAEDFAPTETVDGRDDSIKCGELDVKLFHYGPGHTDNDLVVFIPALNLLHMGDLLFHKRHPFIDREAGATTTGWQASVREAMKLCDAKTVIVPGHGDLTDRAGLRMQVDYFDKLRQIVRHAKDVDGMTREEVVTLESGAFEGYEFQQMWARVLGAVYDELVEQK